MLPKFAVSQCLNTHASDMQVCYLVNSLCFVSYCLWFKGTWYNVTWPLLSCILLSLVNGQIRVSCLVIKPSTMNVVSKIHQNSSNAIWLASNAMRCAQAWSLSCPHSLVVINICKDIYDHRNCVDSLDYILEASQKPWKRSLIAC